MVSQVERGITAPSAGVVYAIANELSISLDYLFGKGGEDSQPPESGGGDEHEPVSAGGTVEDAAQLAPKARSTWGRASGPGGEGIVQRVDDRSTITLSGGVLWQRLTPQHDSRVDLMEVVYPAHSRSTENQESVRHDGREYLVMIEGTLEVHVGFETLTLVAGDSLAFDPTTPHQYRNVSDEPARHISIITHDLA